MDTMEVTFKHSGNSGDIIYSLAALQAYRQKNPGHKIILYLNLGVSGFYYKGASHPVTDDGGKEVMLNGKMASMLMPLIEEQPYIHSVRIFDGEIIHVDLDKVRREDCGMPYFPIQRWYGYLIPDLYCDISKPWLFALSSQFPKKIIINRTSRYTNKWVDYRFLREYDRNLFVFAGLEQECQEFNEEFGLDIPLLRIDNFLSLAGFIGNCHFFIGNQSMCFGIAEGLKRPRILESCDFAPNVIPVGEDAYDFLYTDALKHHFQTLYKKYVG